MTKENTYWAIECQPFSLRSKPWIHAGTVSSRRKYSWELLKETGNFNWSKIVDERRSGMMRAVKVHVTRVEKS